MMEMHTRYQQAQEFNNAALHDSEAGLAQSSHDALGEAGSRGEVVGELVDARGLEKEMETIWLNPNAETLGAVLDKHLTSEVTTNISVILTGKNADGSTATVEQRAAAIEFVQTNREGINAALSAVLLFANRGGDLAAVRDNAAVSALLGIVGADGAVEGWHQAGWLLTDANGKIDLSTFNSLGMLAATLRASGDAASAELGSKIDLMLSNSVDAMRQNAEAAREDPSKIFSEGGTETERRAAQLVIGELMYQSEFYIAGEGGSANGRFAAMGYYEGTDANGTIQGTMRDLSGDSLDQFNAAYGKYEGLAGIASTLDMGLAAPPEGAEGAAATFGVASAWLEQRVTSLEAADQLRGPQGPDGQYEFERLIKKMEQEALYDNPAMRDVLSPVVVGREEREERDVALNGLWDNVVDPRVTWYGNGEIDIEHSSDMRQAIAVAHDLNATPEELAAAAAALTRSPNAASMHQDLVTIASHGSSIDDVRAALARIQPDAGIGGMSDADVGRFREQKLESLSMSITESSDEAGRQATKSIADSYIQQNYEDARRQGMNTEAGAAFDALVQATSERGEILLAPQQDYTNAVELAKNLFGFNGIDEREQKVLDTLSNPSSTPEELHGAVDYVGNRFYADHSTGGQRDAYTTLMNEDASRQEQNKAAEAITAAARVDWDRLQQQTLSPTEAISMRETQIAAPDTSAEDRARLQQEIDLLKQTADSWSNIGTEIAGRYEQLRSPDVSYEDQFKLYQEATTLQKMAESGVGDGRSQLDYTLPQQGTFTDLTRRTVEGYFNGPLGRDAMANQQQTLDEFGILNPHLATFKAETAELNPESQRIEDREMEQERKAEERRRRGLGGEGQG
jgi:hypothetical protein